MDVSPSSVLSSFPILSVAAITVVILGLLLQNVGDKELSNIPYIGKELGTLDKRRAKFLADGRDMMRLGYRKWPVFQITTQFGPVVMLSRDQMVEALKQPDDVIDMIKPVEIDFETKLTKLDSHQPIVPHAIRADLTPALGRIIPQFWPEIQKAVSMYLPPTDDWTSYKINDQLTKIVAIVAGSVFIGPDLCYRDEWITASVGYTVDVMTAATALKRFPAWLRPFAALFEPKIKRSQQYREDIKKFLGPVVRERKAAANRSGYEKPWDMLQWMIDKSEEFGIYDDEEMATIQLGVGLVSIHSTSFTALQALYDLAAHPEIVDPLREEIRAALKEGNGTVSKEALYNCKLLDSFVKESQRLNPITFVIGKRVMQRPLTLSDGTHLPTGTTISIPADAVGSDPTNYPNPEEFDAWRFVKLRSQKEGVTSNYHQLVTSNKTSLFFGYGKHACPGRFFAAAEIKLILAHLVMNYDIELVDKEKGRPRNHVVGDTCVPDLQAEIMLRRARTA